MSLSHSPSIVRNGLVLYLDTANSRSYPGSGTSWTDLSGNGNNATWDASPTFTSSNNGYITLGTRYATVPASSTYNFLANQSYSICTFAYYNATNGWRGLAVVSRNAQPWYGIYISSGGNYNFAASNNSFYNLQGSAVTIGWHYVCGVVDISNNLALIYVDGILQNSASFTNSQNVGMENGLVVGYGGAAPGSESFSGFIGNVSIYNKALSANEISQNFNALKGRYGL